VKQVSYSAREKCDFKKIVLDPSGDWLTVEGPGCRWFLAKNSCMGIAILIVEVSLLSALWIQMKKMAFQRMFLPFSVAKLLRWKWAVDDTNS